ncbi:MAG TPA: SRPBCC family protein [Candidatus Binatia bacterium]
MTMYPTRQSGGRFSESSLSVQRWRQERGDGFNTQSFLSNVQNMDEEDLARALGWFSIGLGVAEILAPRTVARLIGVRRPPGLFGFLGAREITSGVGILTQRRPASWLWSRVGGDIMDLALLALALATHRRTKGRIAAATAAVAGITALDLLCSEQLSDGIGRDGSIRTGKSVHVNRPPEEVYNFWKNYENFPRFMYHLESVKVTGDKRSHWVAKAPAGMTVEWDAETIQDIPNERIAWRSLEGSTVPNRGEVRFERAPGGRGTIVRVAVEYRPPAGPIGAAIAKLFGREPGQQIREDLRRLKQLIEAGEIITTEGQPAGRARSTSLKYDITSRRNAHAKNALEKNEVFQKEERI